MDELKEQMNNLNPANSQVKILKKVHKVLEEINKAFFRAQKDNLRRFLTELEKRANEYLDKLSANDFHGTVRLVQTANDSTEIHLYSSNGTEITNPSGSQKTVMYISVLFAISDFTQEKRDEDYPLFFDAATSSFGDSKESDFYNVIDKIDKQCIIVTKDFITRGKVREEDINKLTCSVYRIKKVDGFDQTNMATIRTIINKINRQWNHYMNHGLNVIPLGNDVTNRLSQMYLRLWKRCEQLLEARGKIFGAGYEIFIIAFFIGLYHNRTKPLIEDRDKKKVFGQAKQYWGNIENRIGRTSYGNIRRYIFAALIARTDIDFIALDKGEITLRTVVDKMMEKMEEYANYGFDYIEDKLANDPNYYFSDVAFLTEITNMLVASKTTESDNDLDDELPESLD